MDFNFVPELKIGFYNAENRKREKVHFGMKDERIVFKSREFMWWLCMMNTNTANTEFSFDCLSVLVCTMSIVCLKIVFALFWRNLIQTEYNRIRQQAHKHTHGRTHTVPCHLLHCILFIDRIIATVAQHHYWIETTNRDFSCSNKMSLALYHLSAGGSYKNCSCFHILWTTQWRIEFSNT